MPAICTDENMATGHRRRPPPRKGGTADQQSAQGGRRTMVSRSTANKNAQTTADSDSELSDAPDEGDSITNKINGGVNNGTTAKEEGAVGAEGEDGDSNDEDDDEDDGLSQDLDATDSDDDMAARLQAAGDGESLLGSAASDDSGGETDEEEERFIIEDAARRQAKRRKGTSVVSSATDRQQSSSSVTDDRNRRAAAAAAAADKGDPFPDRGSGSLSPETLAQLGLDDLFDGADAALHSSSEPSFTDSFGSSSESEDGTEDGLILEARPDDDQLTTDDEDSGTDISDLENDLLSANFLGEALAAGAGTQMMPSGTNNGDPASGAEQNVAAAAAAADIPLLVIEDLDGRLIYARAGDGEAVFGSDGEFEIIDDSDDDSDDDDLDDLHFRMDDLGYGAGGGPRWGAGWRTTGSHTDLGDETDEGETTDELPNEDMPFPRLLVGSVAPHGGRNARRARALAARSRKLSPTNQRAGRSRESSAANGGVVQLNTQQIGLQDVDFAISTEDLARDPKATLEAAAKSLGLTVDEVAQLVIGSAQQPASTSITSPVLPFIAPSLPPSTPASRRSPRSMPQMGSFMPTSSKSVHRAVIDGSRQAPSPFTNRHGTQRKGLSNRKRQTSHAASLASTSKRMRRDSMLTDVTETGAAAASLDIGTGANAAMTDASENDNEASSSHDPGAEIDEMDLDDVMDATLLWRGSSSYSSSPPHGTADEKSVGMKSPALRAATRSGKESGSSPPKGTGLNLSAVARWHRIPMGAFRDGQVAGGAASSSHAHQPLGTFLLTRGRGGNAAHGRRHPNGTSSSSSSRIAEHSPFRGRSRGESIHLGQAPKTMTRDSFMVSPVLWPTRHGTGSGTSMGGSINGVGVGDTSRGHDVGQARTAANGLTSTAGGGGDAASVVFDDVSAAAARRKMMTRREKRERKARKAALKAAAAAAGTPRIHPPLDDIEMMGSPAADLPHLNISDASPNGSPLLSRNGKPLSAPPPPTSSISPSLSLVAQNGMSSEQFGYRQQQRAIKSAMAAAAVPIDIQSPSLRGQQRPTTGTGGQSNGSLPSAFSPSSSLGGGGYGSGSGSHQPPSSVFGMPLHSPLFGSVLNPPNLGFRDDLDDRDEEGILTI